MFVLPKLEAYKTSKVKPSLTIGFVNHNSLQFATPASPLQLIYGLSPPFGKANEEMDDKEVFGANLNVSDAQQVEFLGQLDERIADECHAVFGKKVRTKSVLVDGVMKVKVAQDIEVVDASKRLLSIEDLRAGDKVVPIFKISSLWSSGGEAGACLRIMKLMVVGHAEPIVEPPVDWAF